MAEQETVAPVAAQEAGESTAEASAATKNTVPGAQPDAGQMIPKSRFDEVNRKLRDLEKAQADAVKAQEEAARKADAEQGRYKELWEKAEADKAKATAETQAARQEALRLRVVGTVPGFPAAWADRLRGETEEEMSDDAKTLMAAMPKPSAPNANGVPGDGGIPRPDVPGLETIREQAARIGVSFAALKRQYGINE